MSNHQVPLKRKHCWAVDCKFVHVPAASGRSEVFLGATSPEQEGFLTPSLEVLADGRRSRKLEVGSTVSDSTAWAERSNAFSTQKYYIVHN